MEALGSGNFPAWNRCPQCFLRRFWVSWTEGHRGGFCIYQALSVLTHFTCIKQILVIKHHFSKSLLFFFFSPMSRWFSNTLWVKPGLWSCGQKWPQWGQDFTLGENHEILPTWELNPSGAVPSLRVLLRGECSGMFQWSHSQGATGKGGMGEKPSMPRSGVPGVLCRAHLLCKQLHCCGACFN